MVQHVEIVLKRAHPRIHFFFLGAGQEADVFTHWHGDAGDDDFREILFFQRLRQCRGQRHQRLAAAGLAEQGDEVDVGIHQRVQCKILLTVTRGDAPDAVALVTVVLQRLQDGCLAADFLDQRLEGLIALEEQELVDQQAAAHRSGDAVIGVAGLLPGLHVLAVAVPEILRQCADAGVEQVGVFKHLVVEIILGRQAQCAGLDAHVDVFRHQDDLTLLLRFLQVFDDADDLVVGLAAGQAGRQRAVDGFGLQEQLAFGRLVAVAGERYALGDVVLQRADDFVEVTAGLARVARDLRHAFFVAVQLLERGHRDE